MTEDANARVPETYADGVLNIHFCGGQVRFDLMTIQPGTDDGKGNLKKALTGRLIMSPQGFLTLHESSMQLMAKLEESGIISKN